MSHPAQGLPPADPTAGNPGAAARLRAAKRRLGPRALEAALALDPTLSARHDDIALRLLLRDYDRHIEQLARALETGEDRFVVQYGEWLVPVFRHRHIPMRDFVTLLAGLRDATAGVLTHEDTELVRLLVERWGERLKHHARLPGDHKGNAAIRFFWKAAGIADDKAI